MQETFRTNGLMDLADGIGSPALRQINAKCLRILDRHLFQLGIDHRPHRLADERDDRDSNDGPTE